MKGKNKIRYVFLLIVILLSSTLLTGCGKAYKMLDILTTNKPIYEAFRFNCQAMDETYSTYLAGTITEQDFIKRIDAHKQVNNEIKKQYKADLKGKKLNKYDRNTSFFNTIKQMGYEIDSVSDILDESVQNGKAMERVLLYDTYNNKMTQVKITINDYTNFFIDFIDAGSERMKLNDILK